MIDRKTLEEQIHEAVQESDTFVFPSSLRRSAELLVRPTYEDIKSQKFSLLWLMTDTFKLRINFVTYANIKDTFQIFVKAAIYHGSEQIGNCMQTNFSEPHNPKWHELLDFGISVEDIPRGARLCLGLCAVHKKKQTMNITLEAWVNVLLFEYNGILKSGKHNLSLWRSTKDQMELLNPFGNTGPNVDSDSTCLEVEFISPSRDPVCYPTEKSISEYAEFLNRNSKPRTLYSDDDKARIKELVKPFAEVTESDKPFIWEMRNFIREHYPNALPLLIEATKWGDRNDVTILYDLLDRWPQVQVNTALDLLGMII